MCRGGVQKFDEILLCDAVTASDLDRFDAPVFNQLVHRFPADAKDSDNFIHGERVGIIRKDGLISVCMFISFPFLQAEKATDTTPFALPAHPRNRDGRTRLGAILPALHSVF